MEEKVDTRHNCTCDRCIKDGKGPCQMPNNHKIPAEHQERQGQIYEKGRRRSNHPGNIHPTDQEKHKGPRF